MAETLVTNLRIVQEKIFEACARRAPHHRYYEPRLVAVSKLHPVESILTAYKTGQRNFGENYVDELLMKATDSRILENCREIQWHFIGHLNKNKINKILKVPNLYVIESVDSELIASKLNTSWERIQNDEKINLNIMVQVNTSKEEEKHGCNMDESTKLALYILSHCPRLKFMGFMTIGRLGYDIANGPNPDFINLLDCREKLDKALRESSYIDNNINIELSMGMSNDYEHAIEFGSTNVRVGTAIFGSRPPKKTSEDII